MRYDLRLDLGLLEMRWLAKARPRWYRRLDIASCEAGTLRSAAVGREPLHRSPRRMIRKYLHGSRGQIQLGLSPYGLTARSARPAIPKMTYGNWHRERSS